MGHANGSRGRKLYPIFRHASRNRLGTEFAVISVRVVNLGLINQSPLPVWSSLKIAGYFHRGHIL